MEKEKLNIIYEMVVNNEVMTHESLLNKGFSEEEIKFLFDDDRIDVVDDHYFITYTSDLFDYAKDLLVKHNKKTKDINNMKKAIYKCKIFEPENFEILSAYLLTLLYKTKEENYKVDKIIEVLDQMKKVANQYNLPDANFYYFLTNALMDISEDRVYEARNMKIDKIMLDKNDDRYVDIEKQNKIRKNAYSQKYSYALSIISKSKDRKDNNMVYNLLLTKFVSELATKRRVLTKNIAFLSRVGEVDKVVDLYNRELERRFLKDYDYYNLKLALKYLDIVERDQMPVIIDKEHKTYESAIDDNDFESALSIHMHTSKIQKVDPRESMRYPLLVRIIDKLNEKNKVKIR